MLDKMLRLSLRNLLLIAGAWILCVVLHNLVYALLQDSFGPNGDEPFFLILAVVVIPAYFLLALAYTVVQWLRSPS